jgi:chemotaxis protein CheD
MIHEGASIKNIEARVFGGANRFFVDKSFLNVGMDNIAAAKFVLEEARIPIVQLDAGGQAGRKIYFNTLTGIVRVIQINQTLPGVQEMPSCDDLVLRQKR